MWSCWAVRLRAAAAAPLPDALRGSGQMFGCGKSRLPGSAGGVPSAPAESAAVAEQELWSRAGAAEEEETPPGSDRLWSGTACHRGTSHPQTSECCAADREWSAPFRP